MRYPIIKTKVKKGSRKQQNLGYKSNINNKLACSLSTSIDLDNTIDNMSLNFTKKRPKAAQANRNGSRINNQNEEKYLLDTPYNIENHHYLENCEKNDLVYLNDSNQYASGFSNYHTDAANYSYIKDGMMPAYNLNKKRIINAITSNNFLKTPRCMQDRSNNNHNDHVSENIHQGRVVQVRIDNNGNECGSKNETFATHNKKPMTLSINSGVYQRVIENEYENRKLPDFTERQPDYPNNEFDSNAAEKNLLNEYKESSFYVRELCNAENYKDSGTRDFSYNNEERDLKQPENIIKINSVNEIEKNKEKALCDKLNHVDENSGNFSAKSDSLLKDKVSSNHKNVYKVKNRQIDKILENSSQKYYQDILIDLPHSFFILKNEYKHLNLQYKALLDESAKWTNTNITISQKLEEKSTEIVELVKKVSELAQQNLTLSNKQKILDQYEEENKEYRNLLEQERNYKNEEINRLGQVCIDLRIEKSKKEYENLKITTEKEQYIKKYNILYLNNSLVKDSLLGLERYVESVFESFRNSEIFKKIPSICLELDQLYILKKFFNKIKNDICILSADLIYLFSKISQYHDLCIQKEDIQNQMIQELTKFAQNLQSEQAQYCEFINTQVKVYNYEEVLMEFMSKLINIEKKVDSMKSQLPDHQSKKALLETINQQRKEIETQKMFYEEKIAQLSKQLEDQEDIWDVFKD